MLTLLACLAVPFQGRTQMMADGAPPGLRARLHACVAAGDRVRGAGAVGEAWYVLTDRNYWARGVPPAMFRAMPQARLVTLGSGGAWVALGRGGALAGGSPPPGLVATLKSLASGKVAVRSVALMGDRWLVVSEDERCLRFGGFPKAVAKEMEDLLERERPGFATLDGAGNALIVCDGRKVRGRMVVREAVRRQIESFPEDGSPGLVFLGASARDPILLYAAPQAAPAQPTEGPPEIDPEATKLRLAFLREIAEDDAARGFEAKPGLRQYLSVESQGDTVTIVVEHDLGKPERNRYENRFRLTELQGAEYVRAGKGERAGRLVLTGAKDRISETVYAAGQSPAPNPTSQISFFLKDGRRGERAAKALLALADRLRKK